MQYPAEDKIQLFMNRVLGAFEQYAKMSQHLAFEGLMPTLKLDDPDRFADTLAAHLTVPTTDKQGLLEILSPYERLQRLEDLLDVEVEKMNLDKRINVQVKKQMEKAQKEYYLNEKIKAIHQELGRKDDRSDEMAELKERVEKAGMPKVAREKADQELKRLEAMPPVSAEATVSRNYIEWLTAVPWKKTSKELRDLARAEEILNAEHHGLEKIKERILEFLAVRQLSKETPSQILCFVGPPGVGKSSLATSIARATGREFVRLSLGGVRDEAEIRGHRRTYIGAFPGQIIQMMKKAGTVNPVFLLDEVDKMSMDFRGDPSAALLEVLDPAQNHAFVDHYLDVEYDLSKVMFIATANVMHPIPAALRDRMEVIQLSGYTMNEKLAIARQFLVPKQLKAHGLDRGRRSSSRTSRCAPDRELHARSRRAQPRARGGLGLPQDRPPDRDRRRIGGARALVDPEVVGRFLGKPRFRPWKRDVEPEVGVTTGLAWTEVGGELLETEVGLMKGKRQADPDRQARRSDAGVGARGGLLPAQPRRPVRHRPRLLREARHPHPRARGGDPEGRAVGRHHHGDRAGLGDRQASGAARRRHDRRDHPARQGAAGRRHQGQDARGLPGRHHRDHPAARKREGSGRRPRGGAGAPAHPPGGVDGRGPPAGPGGRACIAASE